MSWFSIPENYDCIQRYNDTTLYAYTGITRDTYTINGVEWQKSATTANNYGYGNAVCVTSPQVPSQITPWFIAIAFVLMLCIFNHIIKMIIGVKR